MTSQLARVPHQHQSAIPDKTVSLWDDPKKGTIILADRSVKKLLREGDIALAVAGSFVFFICFYVPFNKAFADDPKVYAQYIIPIIMTQSMIFLGVSSSQLAAKDITSGFTKRLRTLAVHPLSPVLGHTVALLFRAFVSITFAIIIGAIFGFRFYDKPLYVVAFLLLTLATGIAMTLLGYSLGVFVADPERVAQFVIIPQLFIVLLSTGMVKAETFPHWLQFFVRNQPVSQVIKALRQLATNHVESSTQFIAWGWIAGLSAISIFLSVRAVQYTQSN